MRFDSALVTGASGGIGYAFAKLLAPHSVVLVLVARSGERLSAIKSELEGRFPVRVRTVVADLAEPGAAARVYRELEQEGIDPDVLINNAGVGELGPFVGTDTEKIADMLMLNVVALTELTRLVGATMASRGKGRILNVASTAAFQPGPLMAVYYASKAYVLSFSEALAYELKDRGVTVTALCPGPTATRFAETASMEGTRLFAYSRLASPASVARYGYAAMLKGKTVAVHGLLNRLGTFGVRLSPKKLLAIIVSWLHGKIR